MILTSKSILQILPAGKFLHGRNKPAHKQVMASYRLLEVAAAVSNSSRGHNDYDAFFMNKPINVKFLISRILG